jgi:pyroglutamyl-peptidase
MTRILVTGFGPFPGITDNPSDDLMRALGAQVKHFKQLGILLEARTLPVVYEGLAGRLSALVQKTAPDAILHFGVATRRKMISIETRAHNRRHPRAVDAQGAQPGSAILYVDGPETLGVQIPAARIASRIRRAGIAAQTSRDAGRYLCNATLYETLRAQPHLPAGFIHIPLPGRRGAPDFPDIVEAADIAILALAAHVHKAQSSPRRDAAHRICNADPAHG